MEDSSTEEPSVLSFEEQQMRASQKLALKLQAEEDASEQMRASQTLALKLQAEEDQQALCVGSGNPPLS